MLALVLAVAATVVACESRTLSEADCALVKDRLEKAWQKDAVAAMRLADTDQYRQFIRDERDRIGDAWMSRCEPMRGREVDSDEIECLAKAETIDDVYACAR